MRLAILGLALALLAQHATAINFCPFINPIIPKACTHDAACDSVTCDVTIGRYFDLSAAVQLNLCQAPASLDLSLGIEKPVHLTWSHDWSLGTVRACVRCRGVPQLRVCLHLLSGCRRSPFPSQALA